MKCLRCGFDNPTQMRYCGDCGAPLVIAPTEGEIKEVAVLFADICDFTAMVAAHDPEQIKEKIDSCLGLMEQSIRSYDGLVGKFIGDAVMAIFGIPVAHEDDAERAVKVGMLIRDKIRSYGEQNGIKTEVRVGVNIGETLVMNPEGSAGREVNVFGDTVNVASRLEDTGVAGQIVVSREIYKKTREFFDYVELPPIKAKGVAEPLRRYQLIGEKAVRGKTRGFKDIMAPMIGRDTELRVLTAAYDRVLESRKLQIAAVIGEAGIGKTRLVEEFIAAISRDGKKPLALYGRCLGYAGAPSFSPFLQIFKQVAGIKDDMSVAEMQKKATDTVTEYLSTIEWGDIDPAWIILELLSLSSMDKYSYGHNSSQMFDQVLIVMEQFFRTLASMRPLVLFVEDIHWADGATMDLVRHLSRVLTESQCMLLFNSRPPLEYSSAVSQLLVYLSSFGNFQQINLVDLTPAQSRELVHSLLTIDKLSEGSKKYIVERSGGNPFFVEEIIKGLIEAGIVEHRDDSWVATRQLESVDVPDSIEGVLRSRLDHLPRLEKKVIQRAAVVGRVFWRKMVHELMEENIVEYLLDLESRDMINQRLDSIFEDDVEYIFKHALLHESVYQSLLKKVRQELHLKTALWIENIYQDRVETCLNLIAFHFEMGEDKEKAADYYIKSAQHAASLYDNSNAKEYYAKTTVLTEDTNKLLGAYIGWGEICTLTDKNDEALEKFETARSFCRTKLDEASVLQKMGDVYEKMSSYELAREHLQWAQTLIAEEKPNLIHARVLCSLSRLHHLWGDMKESYRYGKEAEAILNQLCREDPEALAVRANTYSNIANAIEVAKKAAERYYYRNETLRLYKELGNLYGVGKTLNGVAIDEWEKGNYQVSLEQFESSYQICGSCGNRLGQAIACNNLGEIYVSLGDYEKGHYYFQHYLALNAMIGNRLGDGYAHAGLGRIALEKGEYVLAETELELSRRIFLEVDAREKAVWLDFELATLYSLTEQRVKFDAIMFKYESNEDHKQSVLMAKVMDILHKLRKAKPSALDETWTTTAAEYAGVMEEQLPTVETLESYLQLWEFFNYLGDTENASIWQKRGRGLLGKTSDSITDENLKNLFIRRIQKLYPILD
jgi:class 3 adenylate cyclase/tetratricopeptide (TPR) repeat protein